MDSQSPYAPPSSNVVLPTPRIGRREGYLLASLTAALLLTWLLAVPELILRVRHGDIAPLALVMAAPAFAFLGIAALFVLRGSKASIWAYLVSALFSFAAYEMLNDRFVRVSMVIALLSALVMWLVPKFRQASA